jgi:hypothetical protein
MFFGVSIGFVGLSFFLTGLAGKLLFDYGLKNAKKLYANFPFKWGMVIVIIMGLTGSFLIVQMIIFFVENNYSLPAITLDVYHAILGLYMVISGAQIFAFLLLSRAIPLMIKH